MILGHKDSFKGCGYVCFLDVLGFSEDVTQNWSNVNSNPLSKIQHIKNSIPVYRSDEDCSDTNGSRRLYVPKISTVSDSITICFGIEEKPAVGDMVLGLEAVLGALSHVWLAAIDAGYTVRGAIDLGEIFWSSSEIIGPAFINAYHLESNVAKNSRIIASPNLNSFLCDMGHRYRSNLTDHLLKSFRKDVDGYVIVNPNLLCGSKEGRTTLAGKLKTIRDQVKSRIVREKYNPLIHMVLNGDDIWLRYDELSPY